MPRQPLLRPSFIEVALEAVRRIQAPLLLFGVVETVLLMGLLVTGRDAPGELVPIVYALPMLALLVAVAHFVLECIRMRSPGSGVVREPDGPRMFARSDTIEYRSYLEGRMLNANLLVLIGTGLTILDPDPFLEELMTRASREDRRLEIYMADPTSPAVEARLIEEESGDMQPRIGKTGIRRRLNRLLNLWKRLRHSENISIGLFTHYPTFALMIVDEEYFIYPYGYATLGNFSPVLRFSKDIPSDQDVIKFLDRQYERVKENAVDAEMAFQVRDSGSGSVRALHPFAVYFVPPESSALYQFGTEVLGYDVRGSYAEQSPASWRDHPALTNLEHKVGDARDFGFHLTLSDALYFINESGVRSVWEEVKFLVRDFKPFDLVNLRLKSGFPDADSISIVVDDPSGSLEALHCELVHRVYRRAAASNYTLGVAEPTRDQDMQRAHLMIKRYGAPYILQRFRPHFTLLTDVPVGEQEGICQALERVFHEQGCERTMRVRKLARMSMEEKWVIAEEVKLG